MIAGKSIGRFWSPSSAAGGKKKKQKNGSVKPRWQQQFESVRLIELARYPPAISHFERAFDLRASRRELDNRRNSIPPWESLAEIFNNYERHVFTHAQPDDERLAGFDPHAKKRPQFSGDVLKQHFTHLRTQYTTTMSKFTASDHHNGQPDEEADEFCENFANRHAVSLYQFFAWKDESLVQTGRTSMPFSA